MALRETAATLERAERLEHDLFTVRSGQRLAFRPVNRTCANCGLDIAAHVRESAIAFCPEWALRERWGR